MTATTIFAPFQVSTVPGTDVTISISEQSDGLGHSFAVSVSGGSVVGDPKDLLLVDSSIRTFRPASDTVRDTSAAMRDARAYANRTWLEAVRARNARVAVMQSETQTDSWDPFSAPSAPLAQAPKMDHIEGFYSPVEQEAPAQTEITEGFWSLGERVFKVQLSLTSGHLYAKELTSDGWTYVPGAMRTLAENGAVALTKEAAEKFGHLYGVCAICGRRLTNEQSISRGIGPVCAEGQGW